MRTLKNYFLAAFAMVFIASASAFAQQGARRNSTVTPRQESQAERKQEKVNEVQKPTNVVNQAETDARMRSAGGTQSNRRDGNVTSGSSATRPSGNGSVNGGSSANRPSGNGSVNGGSSANRPPANGGHNGGTPPPPSGNRPPANGGYPSGYNYPGVRPALPPARVYDNYGVVTRTNASEIVVRTTFRTREDAYDYVARLLEDRFFTIGAYGNGYSWLQTDITFIPTPFDWTNPMTHNQFRIRATISQSLFGVVRVTFTGEWRESMLSSAFSVLRFQPSDRYSTYYAWSILEDIAEHIPATAISYR